MTPPIHVVLVGDDPVRNLTPAFDQGLRPREVVLVVSPQMREQAQWLAAVLEPRGIKTTRWPIDDAWNIVGVRDTLFDRVAEREGEPLVLNASGGTKPMAIAAFDVFRGLDKPVFYVHPVADRVVWLHPDDRGGHDLADRIDLRTFLAAHGAEVTGIGADTGVPKPLRTLTRELIAKVDRFAQPLATLNWLAGTARGSLRSKPMRRDSRLADLVSVFARAGVLEVQGDRLVFPDEDARFFTQGGWLEAHTFGVLWGMQGDRPIQDLARGVEVRRSQGGKEVRNELDVCCLADNALYLIEAKTKRFDDGGAADVIYKIDSLKELLGAVHARALVVSYQPIGEAHRRRAADLGIATCVGAELKYLEDHLRHLIPAQR